MQSGNPSSTSVLQEPAGLSPEVTGDHQGEERLHGSSTANTTSNRGAEVVATTFYQMEWEVPSATAPRSDNRDRCLNDRLECIMSGNKNWRALVSDRTTQTHKLSGVAGSFTSSKVLCQRQREYQSPPKDGQYNSPYIYKQIWRDCFSGIESPDQRAMAMVPGQEHFPPGYTPSGVQNVTADEESRVMRDRTDWMLCPQVFSKINQLTGPLQVDLFAFRLTHHLRDYVSWRPDPDAMATDAFSLNWKELQGFANPPWNLVSKVISQVGHQEAQLVLVAPVWKSEVWYPTLLEMFIQEPLLLPSRPGLIQPTHRVYMPDITPQLAAWVISGVDSKAKRFRKKLQSSSLHHGDRKHQGHMTPYSTNGWAAVTKGVAILFQEISVRW